jgi:hypothetical protein
MAVPQLKTPLRGLLKWRRRCMIVPQLKSPCMAVPQLKSPCMSVPQLKTPCMGVPQLKTPLHSVTTTEEPLWTRLCSSSAPHGASAYGSQLKTLCVESPPFHPCSPHVPSSFILLLALPTPELTLQLPCETLSDCPADSLHASKEAVAKSTSLWSGSAHRTGQYRGGRPPAAARQRGAAAAQRHSASLP